MTTSDVLVSLGFVEIEAPRIDDPSWRHPSGAVIYDTDLVVPRTAEDLVRIVHERGLALGAASARQGIKTALGII